MITDWQQLVEALRNELKEYGALRSIFDEQQKAIFDRDAARVSQLAGALDVQIGIAANFRDVRVKLMREIAQYNELPLGTTLSQMKSVFPAPAQELLKALSSEINSMIAVLRRRSRQNQMLLSRTCEIMEQTLRLLRPEGLVKTYNTSGFVSLQLGGPVGSHFQTAG